MKLTYLDVTADVAARERVDPVGEAADALRALGFEAVGLLEARNQADQPGQVVEVLRSADRSAFAVAQLFGKRPHFELRTILRDGSIVETSSRPKHAWSFPRRDHPAAGYRLAFLNEGASAADAWERHKARLGESSDAPPQDSMALYLKLCDRAWRIALVRRRVGVLVGFALAALFFGALLALDAAPPAALATFVVFMTMMLWIPWEIFGAPMISARLPFPAVEPLEPEA